MGGVWVLTCQLNQLSHQPRTNPFQPLPQPAPTGRSSAQPAFRQPSAQEPWHQVHSQCFFWSCSRDVQDLVKVLVRVVGCAAGCAHCSAVGAGRGRGFGVVRRVGSRWGVAGGALLLVVSLLMMGLVPVAGAVPSAGSGLVAAGDELAASVGAARSGERVRVERLTTGTTEVFANPDGSFTAEMYVEPVRVRKAGAWVSVDSTLAVNPDGSFSPVASVTEMRFSGGGAGPLFSVTRGGVTVDVSWPGVLPAPAVVGIRRRTGRCIPGWIWR